MRFQSCWRFCAWHRGAAGRLRRAAKGGVPAWCAMGRERWQAHRAEGGEAHAVCVVWRQRRNTVDWPSLLTCDVDHFWKFRHRNMVRIFDCKPKTLGPISLQSLRRLANRSLVLGVYGLHVNCCCNKPNFFLAFGKMLLKLYQ